MPACLLVARGEPAGGIMAIAAVTRPPSLNAAAWPAEGRNMLNTRRTNPDVALRSSLLREPTSATAAAPSLKARCC